MGRLEKIVVLTVLFLVAVILAISLNQGDKKAAGANPLASVDRKGPAAAGNQVGAQDAAVQPGAQPGAQPQGAMSTRIQPQPAPTVDANKPALNPGPANGMQGNNPTQPSQVKALTPTPAGSMLRSREGLEESLFNDLYMYTWKAGDTFPVLAERYYGSQKLALRLRTANEGRTEANLKVGDKIFVPNLEGTTPVVQENNVAANGANGFVQPNGAVAAPQNMNGAVKKAAVSADGFYVVQKGDVLGSISQKVYGSAKKWQKIYDANRDVLKDANALKVGMKLRIPE
ncbi:MAG: LysM peptidoglycan-binding domain-containing protein [Planctomycetes bacterium]|nr:LysM peptidoglycan-binding domain-containing protein [Planctomycetota bacterium]